MYVPCLDPFVEEINYRAKFMNDGRVTGIKCDCPMNIFDRYIRQDKFKLKKKKNHILIYSFILYLIPQQAVVIFRPGSEGSLEEKDQGPKLKKGPFFFRYYI